MGAMSTGEPLLHPPAPITTAHDVSEFACGEPLLDQWLRQRAVCNEGRFSRTYVVAEGARVVGYYCLSAGAVERATAPSSLRRNAPDLVPVAVLGRLAVDRALAGRGLGASLLADAIMRVALASQTIGIAAVLVQAKSMAAKRFYLACAEFVEFPPDSRLLFLPIEMVISGRS